MYIYVDRNKYKCLLSVCRLLAPTSSCLSLSTSLSLFTFLPLFISLLSPSPSKYCLLPSLGDVNEFKLKHTYLFQCFYLINNLIK